MNAITCKIMTDFCLHKPKTNFMKKSISYAGGKIRNDLPNELKQSDISLLRFKGLQKRYIKALGQLSPTVNMT